jgi:hypothetical protein
MNRRTFGTGSIAQHPKGYWTVRITLDDGSRVARRRWTKEAAEQALTELLTAYEDRLGYHYRLPRPFRQGSRADVARAIPDAVRLRVFARDGYRCRYCGATARDARLTIDHHVPRAAGGTDEMDNLITSCAQCNLGKGRTEVPLPPV